MKDIIIGFEFEGGVDENYLDEFKANLEKLGIDDIGDDGSVDIADQLVHDEDGLDSYIMFEPVEFRTNPKPYEKGILHLEEILSYLYLATECGIFRTNDTCGLHINVSNKSYKKNQHAHFFCKFAQLFDEHAVLKAFKRGRNSYCRPYIQKRYKRTFKESVRRFYVLGGALDDTDYTPDKYRAVTLRSMTNGRVEIRAPGNKDYQLRSDNIADILKNVKHCATKASNFVVSNHITPKSRLHLALGAKFKSITDDYDVRRRLYDYRLS